MHGELSITVLFLVFSGAAVMAAVTLYARQSLLVAYILLGVLMGPWALKLITHADAIREVGHVGIIFLLFLLGLNLHPQKLVLLLRETLIVTLASSAAFAATGALVAYAFGFGPRDSLIVGAAVMFSSTIIGLKLLPTTVLHHRHTGELIISVLLLQDIIAIVLLLGLQALGQAGLPWQDIALTVLALPLLIGFALVFERFILLPLMHRFDTIQEYVFLTALGWCLGLAQLANLLGLSYEIGAFVAGVALATNPIARFIAESLKPLRDFFLIVFFFSLGAGFELPVLADVWLPALTLAALLLVIKPAVFGALLRHEGEPKAVARETGVRLGQASEFSLLVAVLALQAGVAGERASYLIQATTLITFIVSSYLIMLRYPTPIAVSDRLRRN